MRCLFSITCGFCLCIVCLYILFGWGTLLNQLQQAYMDQASGLFGKYQQSKWPTKKTPLEEDMSNSIRRRFLLKDEWPSSPRKPLKEIGSNSNKRRFLEKKSHSSSRRPQEEKRHSSSKKPKEEKKPSSSRRPLEEGWTNATRRPVEEGWTNLPKKPSEEGWVVVVCVSEGFDSMFQNWWVWFTKLNLDMEVFLVAEDYKTSQKYNTSSQLHVHQGLIDRNMSSIKGFSYNSNNYNKLVSRRAGYILNFLQKNYSTIYSDIDTVWLQDPTPYFKGDFDMWGQSDDSAHPRKTKFCTGFLAIKPTEASKQFIQQWDLILTKSAAANKPTKNQNVFNQLLWKTVKNSNNSMKTMNLPSEQFKTGNDYQFTKPPPTHVVLVHNNFVVGLGNKIRRFNTSGLWTQI